MNRAIGRELIRFEVNSLIQIIFEQYWVARPNWISE
jgi:exonuclease V gamma subunit